MDLLIYLEKNNSRVEYIFNHVFHHVLGLDIKLTTDKIFFLQSTSPKIQYAQEPISSDLFFDSVSILFETDIKKQNFKKMTYQGINVLFQCSHNSSVLPFDPFAASFYMLTRYEEYVNNVKDKMGRFPVQESIAYQHGFLSIPVVDHWILFVKKIIQHKFPQLIFKQHEFEFINTIDVDNALAYKEKNFLRTSGAIMKNFFQFNIHEIRERFKVLLLNKKDPYDNYDKLLEIHNQFNLKTIFFFLLADYGKYDKGLHFENQFLQKKIKDLSKYLDVGIHPSFKSLSNPKKQLIEINRLRNVLSVPITKSRQHYIILKIPVYYQNLIKNGVQKDYSMGYPSLPGFRAGTSYNFYFFDLSNNSSTELLVFPFCVMDVTLNDSMQLTSNNALELIKSIINQVKKVNGCFISIWHNETLSYQGKWLEWDHVYENMIKYILYDKY